VELLSAAKLFGSPRPGRLVSAPLSPRRKPVAIWMVPI
jgi:hypothetical protein